MHPHTLSDNIKFFSPENEPTKKLQLEFAKLLSTDSAPCHSVPLAEILPRSGGKLDRSVVNRKS